MNEIFRNIEYGEGNRPMCKFTLAEPVDADFIGIVFRIDAVLSEDLRRIDVWLMSRENGRVYYNAVRNRIPGNAQQQLEEAVREAARLTKDYTRKTREENYAPTDMLREQLKKIVSEIVRNKVNTLLSESKK